MREPNIAIYMLRCTKLGLTKEILENITVGDVYDMMIEEDNDSYNWPIKATQDDIRHFFG